MPEMRFHDIAGQDVPMLPLGGGLSSVSSKHMAVLKRENGQLRAKMEQEIAQARQQFHAHCMQEEAQKNIDREILAHIMGIAQERYQLLQDQLGAMARACQHEIDSQNVAWTQEYEQLYKAANRVFEEAQIQQLELQKLQGQLQQNKQEEMAEQVKQLRQQKDEQWQKERHTVKAALDALMDTIDQSDEHRMELDDTLSRLMQLQKKVDKVKRSGEDKINKEIREAVSQAEGDTHAASAQFSLTQQAVESAARNAYNCLSQANSNVMLKDDKVFVDMNHNIQANLEERKGVGQSIRNPKVSSVPGEGPLHNVLPKSTAGHIPVDAPQYGWPTTGCHHSGI